VINQATFTGESLPVNAFLGVEVLGGTIPQGTIQVKITKTLDKSLLSQVVNGIQKTRDQKTKTTKIARKFSK
jgi:cation transport ATPase